MAKPWENPPIYSIDSPDGVPKPVDLEYINVLYFNIPNMKTDHLYVSNSNFSLLNDGKLFFGGKPFHEIVMRIRNNPAV